jgi:hypothetical protein
MPDSTKPNDVKSTSVAITLNGKSLGVDAFIKLEQTHEFENPVSDVDALVKREEIAQLLTEQALAIAADSAKIVNNYIAEHNPTPVAPAARSYAPAQSGTQAPAGAGADAIRAVANGASSGDWRVAVDAFDSAKQVRYIATTAFSQDQMKDAAGAWIASQGLPADAFDVWDERRDAEGGKPISSVCNIKVKEAFRDKVPAELVFTERGGVKAVARAKFNSDGSLYFYWANKQVDAAIKYGAFSALNG